MSKEDALKMLSACIDFNAEPSGFVAYFECGDFEGEITAEIVVFDKKLLPDPKAQAIVLSIKVWRDGIEPTADEAIEELNNFKRRILQ